MMAGGFIHRQARAGRGPVRVVATTTDLRALVEAVGGARVAVQSLVPAVAEAEEYVPKAQDTARLAGAEVVVRVGLDYDLWLEKLLRAPALAHLRRGQPAHVDASNGITLLDVRAGGLAEHGHAHGSGNPHYWLDPRNAEAITAGIALALGQADPAGAPEFDRRRAAFLARLDARVAEWTRRLSVLEGRPLLVYHGAWPYFARRFRMGIAGVIEPRPGVPPSPAHLVVLARTARERGVAAIVREVREPDRHVQHLAARSGCPVAVLVASVGVVPQAETYEALFDFNVAALERAAAAPRTAGAGSWEGPDVSNDSSRAG